MILAMHAHPRGLGPSACRPPARSTIQVEKDRRLNEMPAGCAAAARVSVSNEDARAMAALIHVVGDLAIARLTSIGPWRPGAVLTLDIDWNRLAVSVLPGARPTPDLHVGIATGRVLQQLPATRQPRVRIRVSPA
jgi:hypothetical protein